MLVWSQKIELIKIKSKYYKVENISFIILIINIQLYIIVIKPHSHDWCTWPIFGAGSYLPCRRIDILVQLFVTSGIPEGCR